MKNNRATFVKVFLYTLILLSIFFAEAAQASGGEEGGNSQSPVQVVVQIVLTAIVLKILDRFNLP